MKKLSFILVMIMAIAFSACTEDDFIKKYANPSLVSETALDKEFAGMLYTNREYVVPNYTNYFVVMRQTLLRYTQAVGWVNSDNQYVPGEAGISAHWDVFYATLAQYREMEKVFNTLTPESQENQKVFMSLAKIYLYTHLQKMVDLHGAVPFLEAAKLSQNGGDYLASLPAYDSAKSIYTLMLDDLKSISSELNAINLTPAVEALLKKQDFINQGDLNKWKQYCNSLRLRMLTRVSGASDFQSRAQSEINEILSNASTYPVVDMNSDNIQMKVYDVNSDVNAKGFKDGFESWDGNLAGKAMIDHMLANDDPRLRVMFQQGLDKDNKFVGYYLGLDPLALSSSQEDLVNDGAISRYNTATFSRNQFFPGAIITSSEVELLKAEAYLKASNDGMAKASYEAAITNSVNFYYDVRDLTNDDTGQAPALVPLGATEIQDYIGATAVNWDNATTMDEKMALIATQKWLHFSVVQPYNSWAEQRRLNLPNFSFMVDNANAQTLPPARWIYPSSELLRNAENYQAVSASNTLTTKLFWDVN